MKKGLIIFGLALLAVFLFWEGQRKGVNTFAKSATSATESESEEISNIESQVGAATAHAPEQSGTSLPEARDAVAAPTEPVQQMQARQRPPRGFVENRSEKLRPEPGVLRDNQLLSKTWKVWTGVRAVPVAQFTAGDDEVLGKYAGYVIVRDSHMNGDETKFQSENPMVVFDQRMNKVGVISGTVMLTLKDTTTLAKIQQDYDLKVTDKYDHLRVAFVTSSVSSFDLNKFVNVLKKDSRIEKAELEIVSRNYVKN